VSSQCHRGFILVPREAKYFYNEKEKTILPSEEREREREREGGRGEEGREEKLRIRIQSLG